MTKENQQSVIVVGAGIVGVSTAIWLQRLGNKVTLVDRQAPGEGTSYGNAGILASIAVVPVPTPGILAKAPRNEKAQKGEENKKQKRKKQ